MDAHIADLRQKLNDRVPGGLTSDADARLQRTVSHFTAEVTRVRGAANPQEILRLSYESMVKWIKGQAPPKLFTTEVDADTLFASLKPNPAGQADLSPLETQPLRQGPALDENPLLSREGEPMVTQQANVLQPHEDTIKYREVEYNLVIKSGDRNWLAETLQSQQQTTFSQPTNRYNFTVQFNTNFKNSGFGIQPTIQNRLRNIVRLEFVKAILPVESLGTVVLNDCSTIEIGPFGFSSVLGLPSINILVDEVEGNNYGTRNSVDRSLAICQYDSVWRSEYYTSNVFQSSSLSRGYSLFLPKFMKAQRVYTPAPLSNLQTLSFALQNPEDDLLSTLPDSYPIQHIAFSSDVGGSTCYGTTGIASEYIFLQTTNWFPATSYSILDKVLIQGLTIDIPGSSDLITWLQQTGGLSVVGVGNGDLANITDGPNQSGYANWIIVQNNPQIDTTTGTPGAPIYVPNLATFPIQGAGVLNLSRQVQLYLRVITREYDLITNVRSDNV